MKKILWAMTITVLYSGSFVWADSPNDPTMAMLEKMQHQLAQMQNTIDAQNLRIQQLESKRVLETTQPQAPVHPSTTMSDADFQKSLKGNIGEAIPWLKGAKFGGDFRLRMENLDYYDKNDDAGSTGGASDRSRNRYRIRLRFGFEKDYGDDWKVGFRLATGNTTDPNGTNQTLGNPGFFTFKAINVERAYAVYEPSAFKDYGPIKGVKLGAGKFENPFLRYSAPLVWDADVTPEGLYEQANFQLLDSELSKVNFQATAGQFLVNENSGIDQDAQIYGFQGALNVSTRAFKTDQPVDITGALSYYSYSDWGANVVTNTVGTSYLRTNSRYADEFRVLDFYPELVFYLPNQLPLTLWYDYATNLANVGTDDARALGNDIHDADEAWALGFKLGKAKKKGNWELSYGYYEIGANAVVAAFNDSDFGGPNANGFTNRKGHKLGAGYLLTDNITLNWTGYFVRPLNPFDNGSAAGAGNTVIGLNDAKNESLFRSQLDLVYKF